MRIIIINTCCRTMQGFEVVVAGRKYFAFSKYTEHGGNVTSECDKTLPGWSHDVLGHDWACYVGSKYSQLRAQPKRHNVLSTVKYE